MINARTVGDTLVAHLAIAVPFPGDYLTAPEGSPAVYFVVERPPGTVREGSLGDPEADLLYRFRIRAVARHTDVTQAGRAAEDLLHQLSARFLDRSVLIDGVGWEVSGREQIADGGTDAQGQLANATADFEALITASRST